MIYGEAEMLKKSMFIFQMTMLINVNLIFSEKRYH